jgi:hypothetical protein
MSQFDASMVWQGEISPERLAEHSHELESWARMPSALSNAKLHAENDLRRLINSCNRAVWGQVAGELPPPASGQSETLLAQLDETTRQKLLADSKLAFEQRWLLQQIAQAEQALNARLDAERRAAEEQAALERELAEFEVFDAAGKEARFQAWRQSRRAG